MLLTNKGWFFHQTKWYSTQQKRLFLMAYFKFHEKNYWESSKLTDSKINPSRENHAHFISCEPPHKNHPREYFGTTLWFIQIATSVVEKSQILSVAFHLSTTVHYFSIIFYFTNILSCTHLLICCWMNFFLFDSCKHFILCSPVLHLCTGIEQSSIPLISWFAF